MKMLDNFNTDKEKLQKQIEELRETNQRMSLAIEHMENVMKQVASASDAVDKTVSGGM